MQPSLTGTVWGRGTVKACAFELAGEVAEAKSVHEHAARGATVLMPSCTQISLAMRAEERATATWKSSASLSAGAPASISPKSASKSALVQNIGAIQPRWARCEMAGVVVRKMGDFAVERAGAAASKLDGGFALVGCLVADAQNCCCSIKETPHAAGTRAVDAALDTWWLSRCAFNSSRLSKAERHLGARAGRAH